MSLQVLALRSWPHRRVTITDFGVGADVLDLAGLAPTFSGFNAAAIVLGAAATFADYLDAATIGGTENEISWFQFEGNTFVVANDGTGGFSAAADAVIQLSGLVDLSDSVFAATPQTITFG